MYTQLANQFAGYELPKELKQIFDSGIAKQLGLGSRSFMKLSSFIKEQSIHDKMNDVINFYVRIKPARQENESYPEYKNRQKFQQILHKNRKYLYDYSVFNDKQSNSTEINSMS